MYHAVLKQLYAGMGIRHVGTEVFRMLVHKTFKKLAQRRSMAYGNNFVQVSNYQILGAIVCWFTGRMTIL